MCVFGHLSQIPLFPISDKVYTSYQKASRPDGLQGLQSVLQTILLALGQPYMPSVDEILKQETGL